MRRGSRIISTPEAKMEIQKIIRMVAIGFLAFIGFLVLLGSYFTIDAGDMGVVPVGLTAPSASMSAGAWSGSAAIATAGIA